MAQDFAADGGENGERAGTGEHERWPNDAPTAAVAHVVLELDEAITLKRRAAAAWLSAHGDAVPLLPVKPTRLELAVVIALAETYGAALTKDARFVPMLDFITDVAAVKLVQRVMYGARPTTDFDVMTWPEVFMAQASEALAQLGLPRLRAPTPPSGNNGRDDRDEPREDSGEEGGNA